MHPMHPMLRLLATRPQLVADHVAGYADLAAAELDEAAHAWRRQAALTGYSLCALGTAGVLAGVALMLWAVMPDGQIHAFWALWAAPLLPAMAAGYCQWAIRRSQPRTAFAGLRHQINADRLILREVQRQ